MDYIPEEISYHIPHYITYDEITCEEKPVFNAKIRARGEFRSNAETKHLIFDTCSLLHHGEIIRRMNQSIWDNGLNMKIVIPSIVQRELISHMASAEDILILNVTFVFCS